MDDYGIDGPRVSHFKFFTAQDVTPKFRGQKTRPVRELCDPTYRNRHLLIISHRRHHLLATSASLGLQGRTRGSLALILIQDVGIIGERSKVLDQSSIERDWEKSRTRSLHHTEVINLERRLKYFEFIDERELENILHPTPYIEISFSIQKKT